jgi:uncharacterized coiled-coil protein SlyX
MTPELIGILTVGVAVVGVLLVLARMVMDTSRRLEQRFNRMEARMDGSEARMEARMDGLEARMEARMDRIETQMTAQGERLARLDGMLDGLREAMFGRASQA